MRRDGANVLAIRFIYDEEIEREGKLGTARNFRETFCSWDLTGQVAVWHDKVPINQVADVDGDVLYNGFTPDNPCELYPASVGVTVPVDVVLEENTSGWRKMYENHQEYICDTVKISSTGTLQQTIDTAHRGPSRLGN